jgi:hypothetical protein
MQFKLLIYLEQSGHYGWTLVLQHGGAGVLDYSDRLTALPEALCYRDVEQYGDV